MLLSSREIDFLDESGRIVKKNTHAIAAMCGFSWQENVSDLETRINRGEFAEAMRQVTQNTSKLLLVKISDEVGYGVKLNPYAQPLKQGEFVTVYAGEQKNYTNDRYKLKGFSAKERGNMGRFFSHLPTRFQLLQYEFDSSVNVNEVATANLYVGDLGNKNNYPVLCANADIKPGEVMGFSYGYDYWSACNVEPKLFTMSGEIIDEKLYSRKNAKTVSNYMGIEIISNIFHELTKKQKMVNEISNCQSFDEFHAVIFRLTFQEFEAATDEDMKNKLITLCVLNAGIELDRLLPQEISDIIACFVGSVDSDNGQAGKNLLECIVSNLSEQLARQDVNSEVMSKIKPIIQATRDRLSMLLEICNSKTLSLM